MNINFKDRIKLSRNDKIDITNMVNLLMLGKTLTFILRNPHYNKLYVALSKNNPNRNIKQFIKHLYFYHSEIEWSEFRILPPEEIPEIEHDEEIE